MTDGPTHYRRAEMLAEQVEKHPEDRAAPIYAQLAQVHAMLAQTALEAKNTPIRPTQGNHGYITGEEYEKWKRVINP